MATKELYGFIVKQRSDSKAIKFFVFVESPKEVIKWSFVDRLSDREGGIQRRLSAARKRALRKYFEDESLNVIPTSVILAFSPGMTEFIPINESEKIPLEQVPGVEWGKLIFQYDETNSSDTKPAFIVDGQHRLYGMAEVENEALPILCSAILDAKPTEQAFQFIVINNKSSRVPSDLVRSLIVDFDENALEQRLLTARVSLRAQAILVSVIDDDTESPFHQMVNWDRRRGEGDPCVKPSAIEHHLKYIELKFDTFDEDQDALLEFFYNIWLGVRETYPFLWENTDNYLFKNAGFKAYGEYIVDELVTLVNLNHVLLHDAQSIINTTKTITSQINVELWLRDWRLKSLDTSAGREILKETFNKIRANLRDKRDWNTDILLLSGEEE